MLQAVLDPPMIFNTLDYHNKPTFYLQWQSKKKKKYCAWKKPEMQVAWQYNSYFLQFMWDLFSCFLNTPYFANILQLLRDQLQVLQQTSRVINCRHYPKTDCKSALVNFCGLPVQCLSPNSKFNFPEFHETFNIYNTSNQNI